MAANQPELSRGASRQITILHLLQSERELQHALKAQHRLLEQLSDAAAHLLVMWKPAAAGEAAFAGSGDDGAIHCGNGVPPGPSLGSAHMAPYYSLHELLLLLHDSAALEGSPAAATADRVRMERCIHSRLVHNAGLAPAHDLVFGSLRVNTQRLLLPYLQSCLCRFSALLPSLCLREATRRPALEEEGVHKDNRAPLSSNSEESATPFSARPKRARPERKDEEETAHDKSEEADAGGSDASLRDCKRARTDATLSSTASPAVSPASLMAPLLATAAPGLRFRVVCDGLSRILEFLKLMQGLTDADMAAPCIPDTPTQGAAEDVISRFAGLMRQWVGAYDAGLLSAEQRQLPLVCLVRGQPQLRAALRFMLVEIEELSDTLCDEVLYRQAQRNSEELGGHRGGPAPRGWLSSSLAFLSFLPAAELQADGGWPSVADVASLAKRAEVLAGTLRHCIQLSAL